MLVESGIGIGIELPPPWFMPGIAPPMLPNREDVTQTRIRALQDQIEGLECWIAQGRDDDLHHRLEDTRAERERLEGPEASK